jgi:ferrous iron transport protein B
MYASTYSNHPEITQGLIFMQCHQSISSESALLTNDWSIALVGHPNVGKSALFQRLTGQRVMVSNYPGTTVEVARGKIRTQKRIDRPSNGRPQSDVILIDTPGVIAFPPHSDDEQVTERILFDEPLKSVVQVGDAKNLRRTLMLTVQLAETGLPIILALNMIDEAQACGIRVETSKIIEEMGMVVVPTIAVRGEGIEKLKQALDQTRPAQFEMQYPLDIEEFLEEIILLVQNTRAKLPAISLRSLALLWLSGDTVSDDWLRSNLEINDYQRLNRQRGILDESTGEPLVARIQQVRLERVDQMVNGAVQDEGLDRAKLTSTLEHLTTHPVWGWFILVLVLFGLYWFVGIFGASILVGIFEEQLFGQIINPWVVGWVQQLAPIPFIADLLVGEFGLWTMGMTYALALILPIVTTFFLAFGLMEDSGYLPRLAALSNRVFKILGLNGKAVLPMVLGLGCVTMATLTTRVLESKRERLLVTLLLALAIPCSAQLGVVMGLLAGISLGATIIWGGVVLLVMLLVGWLAGRLAPGERTMLLVELPPLRLPLFSNVVLKTLARLEWYLKEVVPLFLAGALIMFILDQIGILTWLMGAGEPLVVHWLGLPAQASAAFLMGFLRRDFGATGLFVMESQGMLTPLQVVVAMVTITLFIPCIASVMMIAKERNWRTAVSMVLLTIPLAFLVGGLLNRFLLAIGWGL